jgi:hypothetical protein
MCVVDSNSGLENMEEITKVFGRLMVKLIHNREVLWFLISPKRPKWRNIFALFEGLNSYFVYLAFFFSNMIEYYLPAKQSDVSLLFTTPIPADHPSPFIDPTSSSGPVVLAILENPDTSYFCVDAFIHSNVLSEAVMAHVRCQFQQQFVKFTFFLFPRLCQVFEQRFILLSHSIVITSMVSHQTND